MGCYPSDQLGVHDVRFDLDRDPHVVTSLQRPNRTPHAGGSLHRDDHFDKFVDCRRQFAFHVSVIDANVDAVAAFRDAMGVGNIKLWSQIGVTSRRHLACG